MSTPGMSTLIRNGRIEADDFVRVPDDAELPHSGKLIVSLARWQQDDMQPGTRAFGVSIPNTVDLASVIERLRALPLLVLEFPSFADGRAYSQARLLRDRYGYTGELRASGDAVVLDQLAMLQRCGFTSFALRADQDPARCLDALRASGFAYQPIDAHTPVVARLRAAAT